MSIDLTHLRYSFVCLVIIIIITTLFSSLVATETVKHAFSDSHVEKSISTINSSNFVSKASLNNSTFADTRLSPNASLQWKYLNDEELNKFIFNLQIQHQNLTRFYSIGSSVDQRTLWVLVISNKVQERPIGKPMFKYVANIHGNEPLGRQLLVFLAQYLVANYDRASRVKRLLDTVEVHLLFSANPDGFERSVEGDCAGNENPKARFNSKGIDLDKDFPYINSGHHNLETLAASKQPETVALMSWIVSNPFVLSANLHSGIVQVSYPFDYPRPDVKQVAGKPEANPTPDDTLFRELASTIVKKRRGLQEEDSSCFDTNSYNVSNGAFWSKGQGTMQDFNYLFSNCFEITIGLSCCKHPNSLRLKAYWENNQEALFSFMEQVHLGVKGVVQDARLKKPIENVMIKVIGIESNVTSNSRGEFWRLLPNGKYDILFEATGYQTRTMHGIKVKNRPKHEARWMDVQLQPLLFNSSLNFDLKPAKESYDFDDLQDFDEEQLSKNPHIKLHLLKKDFLTKPEFKHHNDHELEYFLDRYNKMYPNLTRLYSVGKSVKGRKLWVLEISDNPGQHEPGEPEFKYVANIHGNEVVGRELMLLFIQSLLENYHRNETIRWIVDNTRIHVMPCANPDGYAAAKVGECDTENGRANSRGVDLNRNFPDRFQFKRRFHRYQQETKALMKWIKSYPFVLSISFHGGALVANYPFDGNLNKRDREYTGTPDDQLFRHLAMTYAKNHENMYKGRSCESVCDKSIQDERFPHGIINGAFWYVLYGGMQDFNYLNTNCFEITVELGCYKYPYVDDLPKYWNENRVAVFNFVLEAHKGVRGFVFDQKGNPIPQALIGVKGIDHYVKSALDGDYWRLLLPGNYTISVDADGYLRQTRSVSVTNAQAIQLNFTLLPDKTPKAASIEIVHKVKTSAAWKGEFYFMYTIVILLTLLILGSFVYHIMIYCRYYKHGFQKLNGGLFFETYNPKQKLMRSSFKQDYDVGTSDEDDDDDDLELYNVKEWQYEKSS